MSVTVDQLQPLAVGTIAPSFSLPASGVGDRLVSLADYAGKNLVIVFYPKDQTPGCTRQLCALRDDLNDFQALNCEVVGANPGSLKVTRFAEKENYPFPILVDADKAMATAYQALNENGGIQRTVYIVDSRGVIRYAQQGLPPDSELLEVLRQI